jgi:hypothetical protein
LRWWGSSASGDVPADEDRQHRLVELINQVGKGALYDIIDRAGDPKERWAAFSALCSLQSSGESKLRSLGSYGFSETHDERFIKVVQELALSSGFEPKMRRLAIQAIWSLPPEQAAPTYAALLAQAGVEADVFMALDSYNKPLPESLKAQAVRRALDVLSNPAVDENARGWSVGLLRSFPETIVNLVQSLSSESSVMVRRGVADEAARLVAEKPGDPKADAMIGPLLDIARNDGDLGTRKNILSKIDTKDIRNRYGDRVQQALLSIATGSDPVELRLTAVRGLAKGGYTGSIDRLKELSADPSPEVAQEAVTALKQLTR